MGFYNVVNPSSLQTGQPEDVSQVLANFNAIAAVLNGGVDNTNIATAAAIALTKLAPGSAGRVLGMDQTPNAVWVPGMQQIADQTLSTTAQFDFTGLPQTFKHLAIFHHTRSAAAALSDGMNMRPNANSTSNYYNMYIYSTTGTVLSAPQNGVTQAYVQDVTGQTSGAGNWSSGFIFIPSYSVNHTHSWLSMGFAPLQSGSLTLLIAGGLYNVQEPINRILAWCANTPFAFQSGSQMTIYGLG